jgi:hypothetical protein
MKKMILAGASALGLAMLSSPASAGVVIGTQASGQPDGIVQLDVADNGSDVFLQGSINSGSNLVFFTGLENIIAPAQGQARIIDTGLDGFTSLKIDLGAGFAFSMLELNLNAATSGQVLFTIETISGENFTRTLTASGQNFFNISTDDGSLIKSVTLNTAAGAGAGQIVDGTLSVNGLAATTLLQDVRQVRIGGAQVVAPVPEPATWAMMLFGFGAVGYSMRRRKVSYKTLQAV